MIDNYTRVTTILYPLSGLDKIDQFVVQKAAERGTKVHKICEAIMMGLGEWGIDDETAGYIESFHKWWQDGKPIVEIEKRFFDDEYEITGQVDVIIATDDGLAIVDFKTSYRPSKTWPLQGSGYYYLARLGGLDIKKVQFLHLQRSGSDPKVYEYPADSEPFLEILKKFKNGEDYVSCIDPQ